MGAGLKDGAGAEFLQCHCPSLSLRGKVEWGEAGISHVEGASGEVTTQGLRVFLFLEWRGGLS